ncbi:hypothetical protein ACKLNO_01690 [Neisseriaceae bacterium B1]
MVWYLGLIYVSPFKNIFNELRVVVYQTWLFISVTQNANLSHATQLQEEIKRLKEEKENLENSLEEYKGQLDEFIELNAQLGTDKTEFEQLKKDYIDLKKEINTEYKAWQENFASIDEDANAAREI